MTRGKLTATVHLYDRAHTFGRSLTLPVCESHSLTLRDLPVLLSLDRTLIHCITFSQGIVASLFDPRTDVPHPQSFSVAHSEQEFGSTWHAHNTLCTMLYVVRTTVVCQSWGAKRSALNPRVYVTRVGITKKAAVDGRIARKQRAPGRITSCTTQFQNGILLCNHDAHHHARDDGGLDHHR